MTPKQWARATLGEVVLHLGRGTSPKYVPDSSTVFAVNQKCVRNGRVSTEHVRLHEPNAPVKPDSVLRPGDLCVNSTGTGTIGRVGLWDMPGSGTFFADTHVTVVRPNPERIVSKFLSESLLAPWVQREMEVSCFTGSTNQIELSKSAFTNLAILLPPLGEQKKIAAILSSVDEAIESTQAVIDQLQVVKKAMMAELLTRGLPGRHTHFKQTEIGEIPDEWEVRRVGDLCSVITKGATPASQTRDSGEVPFLKVYNIDPKGFVDFSYQPTFIPQSVHDTELKRSRVGPGDVLMNIVGPPLGKVAVVPAGFGPGNINQAIAVFRPTGIEPHFLEACLRAESLFSWALNRAKRTSTQLNLTLELCRDYPLPLPPAEERLEILGLFVAVDERLRAEEAYFEQLCATKGALMSVLLTGEVRVKPDEEAA